MFGLLLTAAPAGGHAQDLEAGKTPQQLFSSNCSACHRTPQGLAKGRAAGSLSGFLTQHYTTGRRSAAELAGYLASVGGEPPRNRPTGREAAAPPAGSRAQEPARTAAPVREERGERRETGRDASSAAKLEQQRAERDQRSKRARRKDEPTTVSTDPDPVIVSVDPVPLFHDRASSRAQELRYEELLRQQATAAASAAAERQAAKPPTPGSPAATASTPTITAQVSGAVSDAPPPSDGQAQRQGALGAVPGTAAADAVPPPPIEPPQPFSSPIP